MTPKGPVPNLLYRLPDLTKPETGIPTSDPGALTKLTHKKPRPRWETPETPENPERAPESYLHYSKPWAGMYPVEL
jgi:hypothetical protein